MTEVAYGLVQKIKMLGHEEFVGNTLVSRNHTPVFRNYTQKRGTMTFPFTNKMKPRSNSKGKTSRR